MCLNQSPANENIWWITGPVICLRILFFLQKNNGKINRFNKVIKPHKIIILTAEITQTEKKTLSSNQLQNKILIFALGHLEPCSLRLALLWISCSFLRIHNIRCMAYLFSHREEVSVWYLPRGLTVSCIQTNRDGDTALIDPKRIIKHDISRPEISICTWNQIKGEFRLP